MKAITLFILTLILLLSSGCDRNIRQSFFDDIKLLDSKNDKLEQKVALLEEENARLKQQVNTLSSMDVTDRQTALPVIEKLTLSKRTGFVDKNKDGTKETLIVYIQPFDGNDDVIKAAGAAEVSLWDLDTEQNRAMLHEWSFTPAELGEFWTLAFLKNYYKLSLAIDPAGLEQEKEYTLKVKFTDYISGKVFETQKAVTY